MLLKSNLTSEPQRFVFINLGQKETERQRETERERERQRERDRERDKRKHATFEGMNDN